MRKLFLAVGLGVSALCSVWAKPACLVCGPNDTQAMASLQAHQCLALHFGSAEKKSDAALTYNGFRLGLAHRSLSDADVLRVFMDEQCDFSGFSCLLLAEDSIGTSKGILLTGLFSGVAAVHGWQCTGLFSATKELVGAQTSLAMSRTNGEAHGFQLGLITYAEDLKGVQIGLLNINKSGLILPLINIGW